MKTPVIACLCMAFGLVMASCQKEDNGNGNSGEDWPSDSIRVVRNDLNFPWEILWGKDDYIWMTERGGTISKLDPKTGSTVFSYPISEVVSNGEGGLLGMVQHPDFNSNGFLYVVYNYNGNAGYRQKVVRFTYSNNTLSGAVTLIDTINAANIHNGSRLLIAGDKLFISTGDASVDSRAQNPGAINGKVLRLNLDGTVPADNPVAGNPYWSLGHRNIQGLVVANNIMYASEHGPDIEDELNIIEKGRNYGWPTVKGPCDGSETSFCTAQNVKGPIWSTGSVTRATSGLDYYNSDRIPAWKNSLLLATLKDATLYRFTLTGGGSTVDAPEKLFAGQWGRLRDVCVSPAGRVYICTSNGSNQDKLIEISGTE
ncbi:Glucose/arabinose dehydrogenase, beta-propeller fold [Filimonas lacunae]|uniref:Glucose/arabinose dehydrogenase, beta-propeller fold n=1 Tax=Filimonas lacunae TaxID=477680 RepID=A0A173MPT6_9BACT|nr:PQQ-dependent sugar dehydrogenase [Filimonas lacunae]BAV09654.1 hypothetical protein FLA_5705 [Filimonas lacunae]SIS76625.1 Glucose/arabinose dehydrogenase, beta-propeller fold [Filimonas lacunae]